jgi:hypothetical protein
MPVVLSRFSILASNSMEYQADNNQVSKELHKH